MICPRCKSYLPNNGKFCPHCGETIQKEIKEDVEKETDNETNFIVEDTPYVIPVEKARNSKKGHKKLVIFAIGILIVIGVFFLLYEKYQDRLLSQSADGEASEMQATTQYSTATSTTENAAGQLNQVTDVNTGKTFTVENGYVLVQMPIQYTDKTIYADDSGKQLEAQYQYDEAGRCTAYTVTGNYNDGEEDDNIFDSVECSYDGAGRLEKKKFDETHGTLNQVRELKYSYGENNNLINVTESYRDSRGTENVEQRIYDQENGLLIGEYIFDDDGNVETYEREDAFLARYWYDGQGRITSESIKDYVIEEITEHNEITNHFQYNDEGLLSEDDEYSYQYDGNKHLIKMLGNDSTIDFTWEGNQLKHICGNSNGAEENIDILYDEMGEITSLDCECIEGEAVSYQINYVIAYETFRIPLDQWQYYLEHYYYYQRIGYPYQDMDSILPRTIMPLLDGYYQQLTIYHNSYIYFWNDYSNYGIYYRLINRMFLKR